MESRELLVANPLLYDDSLEKYIWISDLSEEHRNAQYLFGYFMRRGIYINGFATSSSSIIDLKMYNKKIYELDSLKQEKTVVFYDIWFKDIWATYKERGHKARIINPDIGRDNIVIWGSGVTGEKVFKLLAEAGIKVLFFVDSDESLVGTVKCGLPICSPDVLEKDFTIIEAMEKWKQLDGEICTKYPKRFHFSLNIVWDQITCNYNDEKKEVLRLSNFWSCSRFTGKKIYVYGVGTIEAAFAKCLELMDYEFAGFLTDEWTEVENSEYQVMVVEEILYEENYYIWVYSKEKSQKLKELGLRHYFEYECAISAYGIATEAKFCLDVNLGHTYWLDSKYSGFMVYGAEKKNDYKIAVLGGSTTDGAGFPFKSWSQILYEELSEYGITIYNGGVSGYTSSQELLKLIRDILPLKPDMIVVYDGFNELGIDVQYPFAFSYMKTIVNYAGEYLEKDVIGDYESTVALGIPSGRALFTNWLFCIRNMYAISRENKIKFFSFCQPNLSSKKEKTIREKNMLLSTPNNYMLWHIKEGFRKYMEMEAGLPNYIYDLSHIFDGKMDIYMDICHVWENGNSIIAKEIAKVILPEIKRAQMKKG